ncbi:MAG: hypothetical protein IPK52_09265 [Chloroflexi bacterium]|nr:hypothetical protein [Chloroflexota bacterium]
MIQPQWSSLYTLFEGGREALSAAIVSSLTASGATQYDPFGLMPGISFPRAAKLFIAPQTGAWLRLVPAPDCILDSVIQSASANTVLLHVAISSDLVPEAAVYRSGETIDPATALAPYVTDISTFVEHLNTPKSGATGVGGISSGALPSNIRAMSGGLPSRQVERLMNTMTGAIGKNDRAGAQAALQTVEWGSGAGGWMRSLLAFLGLDSQAMIDYATLSTAYRTAKRLARNPSATLYPGDADARDAVANALDYEPLFFGWKA